MPFDIRMIDVIFLVPLSQGSTQFPEASASTQLDPGPRTGSYPTARDDQSIIQLHATDYVPANVAKRWNSIREYPNGPTPLCEAKRIPDKNKRCEHAICI